MAPDSARPRIERAHRPNAGVHRQPQPPRFFARFMLQSLRSESEGTLKLKLTTTTDVCLSSKPIPTTAHGPGSPMTNRMIIWVGFSKAACSRYRPQSAQDTDGGEWCHPPMRMFREQTHLSEDSLFKTISCGIRLGGTAEPMLDDCRGCNVWNMRASGAGVSVALALGRTWGPRSA